jgi:hypothetical protein
MDPTLNRSAKADRPTWREPIFWALAAGPLVVIVAGVLTAAIAMSDPDPVLVTPKAQGLKAELPAVLGRNRAAEPSK